MSKTDDDLLSCLSAESLTVATELRDVADGPEKGLVLKANSKNLMVLLKRWEVNTHRPPKGSLYGTLFQLLVKAKSYAGMSGRSRPKVIYLLKKALRLRILPETEDRNKAIKFFQKLGETIGEEREKTFP